MNPTQPATPAWQPLDTLEPERQTHIDAAIAGLLATHPSATLDHDPAWIAAKADPPRRISRAYVCVAADGQLMGYAPFFVHPSAFQFSAGGHSLYDHATRRYALTAEPLLLATGAARCELVIALLRRLRADLSGREVAFGLGVRSDSVFVEALHTPAARTLFHVLPHGPEYPRRLLRMSATLDDYLAGFGSKTRQDLRRQERRMQKEADDAIRVAVHTGGETVPAFLDAVEQVSRTTYQWRQLGMGVNNSGSMRQLLVCAAAHGWLRGYVLYCRDAPVAFMIGYLYRGVYLSERIGYDPAWADWSVGNVLHLHVMRDLCTLGERVVWFDFMYGDNSNKARLSTDAHAERNYYLVPRTVAWTLFVAILRAFERGVAQLDRLLQRGQIKARLQRALRRRATARE